MLIGIGAAVGTVLGVVLWFLAQRSCRWGGCRGPQVVDCEARRVYHRCPGCGREWQYDFEAALDGTEWIGFQRGQNQCSLCLGWKPRAWKFCSSTYCELNPRGPARLA